MGSSVDRFSSGLSSVTVELCFGCALAQCRHCPSPDCDWPPQQLHRTAARAPAGERWEFCRIRAGICNSGAGAGVLQMDTWPICYINAPTAQLTPACVSSSLNNLLPVVLISRSCREHLPCFCIGGQRPGGPLGQLGSHCSEQLPPALPGLGTCSIVIYGLSEDEQSED